VITVRKCARTLLITAVCADGGADAGTERREWHYHPGRKGTGSAISTAFTMDDRRVTFSAAAIRSRRACRPFSDRKETGEALDESPMLVRASPVAWLARLLSGRGIEEARVDLDIACVPVDVMDVEIDDGGATQTRTSARPLRRDRDVVEEQNPMAAAARRRWQGGRTAQKALVASTAITASTARHTAPTGAARLARARRQHGVGVDPAWPLAGHAPARARWAHSGGTRAISARSPRGATAATRARRIRPASSAASTAPQGGRATRGGKSCGSCARQAGG